MFDVTTGNVEERRKSRGASIVSLAIHAAIFGIIFAFAAKEVVEKPPEEVEITFFSQKPPPPPPPPPKGGQKKPKKVKPKVEKKPEPKVPQEIVQPEEIPEEIPEAAEVEEVDEDEIDGGVDGGVEGGVKGGKVGGEVGGKEGGVIGGDITSLGASESEGLCAKPAIRYPEQAKALGIEGTVRIKMLVDTDGRVMKRKDELCTRYEAADKKERRIRWHPSLCMEAVSGPEALYYETLVAWGTIKCSPYKSGNVHTRFIGVMDTVYKLD